jgi:hypothetical protein
MSEEKIIFNTTWVDDLLDDHEYCLTCALSAKNLKIKYCDYDRAMEEIIPLILLEAQTGDLEYIIRKSITNLRIKFREQILRGNENA